MSLIRGNALAVPLADESVDLIVTSPPYFALRSYTDGGEHYDGQIGSEATPAEFIDALLAVTAECVRVLKPSGSLWVNRGDKYAAGHGGSSTEGKGITVRKRSSFEAKPKERPDLPDPPASWGTREATGRNVVPGFRPKSLMGMPWRYALACIDDLGLILRAEVIWSKPNGLPESVQDRVRRSHENWFHFTKEPRYFSAVDEIREPAATADRAGDRRSYAPGSASSMKDGEHQVMTGSFAGLPLNPLGKLPGSVWTIPTEPLRVPDDLPQHFAAFPSEWPKRIILGWSPSGICVECGEGRRPVVDATPMVVKPSARREAAHAAGAGSGRTLTSGTMTQAPERTITGESCACPTPDAPTRPAVVLDPFAGTGTSVAVANALGRHGVGLDLSADYLTLARWRCQDPGLRAKVLGVDKPKPQVVGQLSIL